jgi:predicted RNA-binding protein YlxR (DUF448 family)
MCIVCRCRLEKENLLRLQCKDKKLVSFIGNGRSFYLCKTCLDDNLESGRKKLEKSLFKECKNKDEYIVQLKEILTHVR